MGPAAPFVGTRVWLDGSASVRRARAIERDGEVFERHWEMWARQEAALFGKDATRDRAHLVFDTGS